MSRWYQFLVLATLLSAGGCITWPGPGRSNLISQLRRLDMEQVEFREAPLEAVIAQLNTAIQSKWTSGEAPRLNFMLTNSTVQVVDCPEEIRSCCDTLMERFTRRYRTGSETERLPRVTFSSQRISIGDLVLLLADGLSQTGVIIFLQDKDSRILFGEEPLECRLHRIPATLLAAGSFGVGLDPRCIVAPEPVDVSNLFVAKGGLLLRIDTPSGHERFEELLRKMNGRLEGH